MPCLPASFVYGQFTGLIPIPTSQLAQDVAVTQTIIPLSVSQNIARAKSLLKRDEPIRSLDALIQALEAYIPLGSKLMRKAKFEIEVLIIECVTELNRQPQIRVLLETLSKSSKTNITYAPGQEQKLLALLPIIRKALHETEEAKQRSAQEEVERRKNSLIEKGRGYLESGDAPRGKATLRVLADEFGHEPGILSSIGQWLSDAKLFYEAAEFLEQSISEFPKDSKAYGAATTCYMAVNELGKAEEVYLKAIRQFGNHPKTLLNLAKLYVRLNKKEKAFEAAQLAMKQDPDNAEAKDIMERFA